MEKSVLSCAHLARWLAKMPQDFRRAIADREDPYPKTGEPPESRADIERRMIHQVFQTSPDAVATMDKISSGLETQAKAAVSAGDIPAMKRVIEENDATLAALTRPHRVRLVALMFGSRNAFEYARMLSALTENDSESGSKRAFPPLFLADIEALQRSITSRIVRASSAKASVEAIEHGIRALRTDPGLQQPGGMA